jgi:hypothetical protein
MPFGLLPRLGSAEINGIRDREARCEAALDRLSDGLTSSGVHGRPRSGVVKQRPRCRLRAGLQL